MKQKEKISPSALFSEGIHLIDSATENFAEAIQQINEAPTDAIEEALNALKNLDDVVTQLTKELIARAMEGERLETWSYSAPRETLKVIDSDALKAWFVNKEINPADYAEVSFSIAKIRNNKGEDAINELISEHIIAKTLSKGSLRQKKQSTNKKEILK